MDGNPQGVISEPRKNLGPNPMKNNEDGGAAKTMLIWFNWLPANQDNFAASQPGQLRLWQQVIIYNAQDLLFQGLLI